MLVDGYAVPAGTTAYDYVDVFTNAAFGSVAGRVLLGNVQVRTGWS